MWRFPLQVLKSQKFAITIIIVAFILQLLVFTPLGETYNGARGWLSIPGLPNLQPSEFFKLAYVIFLSSRLLKKKQQVHTNYFLMQFVLSSALLYAIFLFIPDL